MTKTLLAAAMAAAIGSMLFAGEPGKPGTKMPAIAVQDLNGNQVTVPTQGKLTAVLFIATKCPVSNAYNERMAALYNEYKGKGVEFVGINSNSTEPAAEVAEHARTNGFGFKVYKDADNVLADKLNAQVTPEVFLVDKTGTIIYHGAIDDSQNPARISKKPLRDALDAALAGRAVANPESKAFGCTIKRVKKVS